MYSPQVELLNHVVDLASKVLTREEMGYKPRDRRRNPKFDRESAMIAAQLALDEYPFRLGQIPPKIGFIVNEIWACPKRWGGMCGASDGSPY